MEPTDPRYSDPENPAYDPCWSCKHVDRTGIEEPCKNCTADNFRWEPQD